MPPRHHTRKHHRFHSGRDSHFYLYSEPICYCDGVPCLCPPDVGALPDRQFLTVYPGWNVWDVWQVNDLPFSIMMVGVDRDRQLRIWVEDSVRLKAPGTKVADPIDLKGGQIEILKSPPVGLKTDQRKEQVPGPAMVVSGPATLRTVRFYNHEGKSSMVWPHDESYLLEKTYVPAPDNPATTGPAPSTITETVIGGVGEPVKDLLKSPALYVGGALALAYVFRKELFSNVRKSVRNVRHSRNR